MRRMVVLAALALSGCAPSHEAQLEARVAELEREVAELRASATAAHCKKTLSRALPDAAQLSSPVPFAVSESNLRAGDAITIDEVRGDRPRFEVNGSYVARGTYTLESADQAELTFTEQVVDSGVCTSSSGRDKLIVKRGMGKFELATTLPIEGFADLSFFVGGHRVGGVLFGRTPTMAQKAQNVAATMAK